MLQESSKENLQVEKRHINGANYTMDITLVNTSLVSIKHGVYCANQDFYHTVLPTKNSILTYHSLQGSSLTLNHENLNVREQAAVLFQESAVPYQHIMKTNAEQKGEFVEIAVNKSYITNLFEQEKDYLEELLATHSSKLIYNLNINDLQLIQQLINHPYQGKLAEHYLNNKVEEAHLLQYHNWRHNKTHNNLKLHQKDKQALYDIKSYITKHFNKDFTIQELALKAGINQTKLKVGFKALFGTTTFKYIHDLRMQRALEMIKSRDYNIYEVAEYVGYKHSHHFSTAFKKYFGQLPTQVIV